MGKENFDALAGKMHTGDQGRPLYREDIKRVLSTPEPELITLSPTEHAEALRVAHQTRQTAEDLLDGAEIGDFVDNKANPIHIRSGSALTEAELQIDRWVRTRNQSGKIIGVNFQVFEFIPDMVVLTSNPRDYHPNSNTPATSRQPVRREANQDDLRELNSALTTSTPKID